MKANPWIGRYLLPKDEDTFFSNIERRASKIVLPGGSPEFGVESLRSSMREIFLCTRQIRKVIKKILALAQEHAEKNFSTPQGVIDGICSINPWGLDLSPAIMITGLAGVGKSQLIEALKRLLAEITRIDVPGHKNIPLAAAWFMTMRNGSGLNSLIRPWINSTNNSIDFSIKGKDSDLDLHVDRKDINLEKLLQLARRASKRDGVCLQFIDEFQFISRSANANALATIVLLQLQSIGPRLLYGANFSLAHRLKNRPQEDRQRLLANPIKLCPEEFDDPDWKNLLNEYLTLAPNDFRFEVGDVAELLHRYTYGNKRSAVELLASSWLEAKKKRGSKADVKESDISSAYLSAEYSQYRDDVEALWRWEQDKSIKLREDLRDPFPNLNQIEQTVVHAEKAIEHFESRVQQRMVDGYLTPIERDAIRLADGSPNTPKFNATVLPLRKPSVVKMSLLEASRAMDDEL